LLVQEFFDAHPHLAQRFPGGVDQFAQMVAGLPPDVLEDLMLVEAMDDQGGMPGGLDGINIDDDGVDGPAVDENPGSTALAQEQAGSENDPDDETEDFSVRHI